MSILVTQEAPLFTTAAVLPDKSFGEISLADYRNKKYVVLFFYPLDFTFVCPTELLAFSRTADEFEQLNVQLLACSVDSQYTHFAWINTPRSQGGLGGLRYPLLSDLNKTISSAYHVLLPQEGVALRGLFLIDKSGIVQHELVNNLPIGRDVQETLRVVRALQFIENNGEVCPANWHEGDPAMKGTPDGIRHYLENTYSDK